MATGLEIIFAADRDLDDLFRPARTRYSIGWLITQVVIFSMVLFYLWYKTLIAIQKRQIENSPMQVFYYISMIAHMVLRTIFICWVLSIESYEVYSIMATLPTEFFLVSMGIMWYQWSHITFKKFGSRLSIDSTEFTKREIDSQRKYWCWMWALILILIIYVLVAVFTLTPFNYRIDTFWFIHLVQELILESLFIVLHLINGRQFIRKARKFQLSYAQPKKIGSMLGLSAFFLFGRVVFVIQFLIYPFHAYPWAFYVMGYYLLFECLPTYLVYEAILMQRKADAISFLSDNRDSDEYGEKLNYTKQI